MISLVRRVKAMVFPIVMYGCDSLTIKNVECWRIDAFKLWCWRRQTLESPLDSKEIKPVHPKGNQSWIFIGRTDAKAEAPILWPFDVKSWLIGKDPDAGKDWGQEGVDRGWDGWMASLTQWTWVWANSRNWWRTEKPGCAAVHGITKSQTYLCSGTTTVLDSSEHGYFSLASAQGSESHCRAS